MNRRDITITLGGVKLALKYEAENLYELTAITGKPYFQFVQACAPREGETAEQAGQRCADLSYVVPLIMAGLAHHDEYASLSHRQLRRKVCELVDRECNTQKQPVVIIAAGLVGVLVPIVAATLVPPGVDIEEQLKADEQGKGDGTVASPLPEAAAPVDAPASPGPQFS